MPRGIHFAKITVAIALFNVSGIQIVIISVRTVFLFARKWETDFYTPPVLGGAALLPFSAPAV